jgi:hypothetical protein
MIDRDLQQYAMFLAFMSPIGNARQSCNYRFVPAAVPMTDR